MAAAPATTDGATTARTSREAARAAVALGERYEIFPDAPLPGLRTGPLPAYRAQDREAPDSPVYALVCDPDLPPRFAAVEALRRYRGDWLLAPLDCGVAAWPDDRARLAIVFDRPAGERVMRAPDDRIEPFDPRHLRTCVVGPIAGALAALASSSLTHRAIRPDNLHYAGAGRRELMLGECVSLPPGWGQPVAYEPLESALADPAGRGGGETADDLFAFGATVLALLIGRRPGLGTGDEALIRARIEHGSYAALVGGCELPGSVATLLRGLLADDPAGRWGLPEVADWLAGGRPPLAAIDRTRRAETPFVFKDQAYTCARGLAFGLSRHPDAAAEVAASGRIEAWLGTCLRDPVRAEAVAAAARVPAPRGMSPRLAGYQHAARVGLALDPAGPIRYRRQALHLRGFGVALAAAAGETAAGSALAEIVLGGLPAFWASLQMADRHRHLALAAEFQALKRHLRDSRQGGGIERCLYEANPRLPCRSPLLGRRYVATGADLLAALEEAAGTNERVAAPADRHIAAFAAAKLGDRGTGAVAANISDEAHRALDILRLLARLQSEGGGAGLPGLAGWLAEAMAPLVAGFHARRLQEELATALRQVARRGDLGALLAIAGDRDMRDRDEAGFAAARKAYDALDDEISRLRGGTSLWPEEMRRFNGQIGVAVSGIFATAIFAALMFSGGTL